MKLTLPFFGNREQNSELKLGQRSSMLEYDQALVWVTLLLLLIGLVIAALYSFAAVFAPRYELKIGEGRLEPGKSVAVHWRRAGGRDDRAAPCGAWPCRRACCA
jgi:hypothetical protein